MKKTFGEIVDSLITVNVKVFFLIEKVHQDIHTREDAKKIQDLNRQRSQLINALNEYFQEEKQIKV